MPITRLRMLCVAALAVTIVTPLIAQNNPSGGNFNSGLLRQQAWKNIGCGDRSILSDKGVVKLLANDCKSTEELVANTSRDIIEKLDGAGEAKKSIMRGDSRIAVMWPNFPPPPGKAPWETPGVTCHNVALPDLAVFMGMWDTASPARNRYEMATWKFLELYNRTIISSRNYNKKCNLLPGRN